MYIKKLCRLLLVDGHDKFSFLELFYRYFLIHIVVISTIITAVFTYNQIDADVLSLLRLCEIFCFFTITFDFIIRLIEADDTKGYLFSFFGMIDFVSSIPLVLILSNIQNDIQTIFGIIAFFKLARYSPALEILKNVIISEQKPLLSALYLMLLLTFFTSTLLYFIERDVNASLSSIPQAMWWSVVTLATLGYGDVVPMTALGKICGGMVAILGFGMFALPAGILANGFSEEMKRLRDVASWNMVARVPLFHDLSNEIISEISHHLRVKRYIKDEVIIKEGDKGNAMYFIFEGEVEVSNSKWTGTLKKGDFFGEIAIIHEVPRTATVRAKTRCQVLELTAFDFRKAIGNHKDLLMQIQAIAQARYNINN